MQEVQEAQAPRLAPEVQEVQEAQAPRLAPEVQEALRPRRATRLERCAQSTPNRPNTFAFRPVGGTNLLVLES